MSALGEKLKKRHQKVWLNWEIAVRRLDKVTLAHSPNLRRHLHLLLEPSDVLDNRVGKHHVKLPIAEAVHPSRVSALEHEVLARDFNRLDIQENDLNISLSRKAHVLPEPLCPADVQDPNWPRKRGEKR